MQIYVHTKVLYWLKSIEFFMTYSVKMSNRIITIFLLWFGILCLLNAAESQGIQKHSWYRNYKPTGKLYIIYFNNEILFGQWCFLLSSIFNNLYCIYRIILISKTSTMLQGTNSSMFILCCKIVNSPILPPKLRYRWMLIFFLTICTTFNW